MSTRPLVADRAARFLARRIDRRGLLTRSALVGSALAVAPSDFVLRPRSAYAAICRCSGSTCDCAQQCCDGYTEFCCTISGLNQCPPGSVLGGWWKVDGSAFCGDGPRYYMDCNAGCGGCGCGSNGICSGTCSGTACGCANGDCNNRKAGCVGFRYGQCNQATACLGPIVCRVVTCTPPWQLDASCTTAVRVDNNTRYHDAPCLHGDPFGYLEAVQRRPDGLRLAGWALDPDTAGSIDVHAYVNGVGIDLGAADNPRPDVEALYPMHPRTGFDVVVPWSKQEPLDVCVFAINEGPGGSNRLLACRSAQVSPVGWLDAVDRVPGGIRVRGWALDPEVAGSIDVHVYVNGVGFNLGRATRQRSDIAASYPQWGGAHGFDAVIPWSGTGTVSVCAYGINVGSGGPSLLGCRSLTVGHVPFGAVDVVRRVPGGIRVAGWAVDPDTASPVRVHVYVGGVGKDIGAARINRPDVAALYPAWGGEHGFDVTIPWDDPGVVDVCAYAINAGAGSNTVLGCRRMDVRNEPFGAVDRVERVSGGIRVAGWAIDPDVAGPVDIHVYLNGTGFAVGPANRSRPDVGRAVPGYGDAHGFDVTIPWSTPGAVSACVYAINAGAGSSHATLGCRAVSS